MELKELFEKMSAEFADFKRDNDKTLKELKEKGGSDPLLIEKLAKQNDAIQKLSDDRQKMLDQIKALETAVSRPGAGGDPEKKESEQIKAHKAAFRKFMCKGEQFLTPEEQKVLSMSDDSQPDGGYLVRPEVSSRIVTKIYETSPMRMLADVATLGNSDSLEMPADLDQDGTSGWVAERGSRGQTGTPQLKWIRIPAQELYSEPMATQRQLDDAMWDVEAWLEKKVSDRLSRIENTAFVGGSGVGQPRGFATYGADTSNPNDANKPFGVIQQVVSGAAAAVTADGLLNLFYALKEAYQKNATWTMQRATVLAIRKLKDGFGRYLWEPALTAGNPDMLLGRPIVQFADMDAVSAGLFPVAVADWKQAYQIVDRFGIRVLRDPFTSKPNVLFYTTKRTGGDVVNFEAIKLQKIST